jgi:3-methyladenine DNA glycosylase AlkC
MQENPNAFKHAIGKDLLLRMGGALQDVVPGFDKKKLLALLPQLEKLELKPRVRLLRDQLRQLLPGDFPKAVKILLASTHREKLSGFDLWAYTEYVQTYGLNHPTLSLKVLTELTSLFTSEFAVRPFLKLHTEETLAYLLKATKDKDKHVRRWASEGTRPRLPWGERLDNFIKSPQSTLPILENLKNDPELYVRKSVANHLNDIAKDHPQLVVDTLKRWQKEARKEQQENIDWILRHALRSLIKAGNPQALALIGASGEVKIKMSPLKLEKSTLKTNDHLSFQFHIESQARKSQKLVVDYIIHFRKANNKTAPKVFKLKTFHLKAGEKLTLSKNHHMKTITTRRYYPGAHFVEIQVNGKTYTKSKWTLHA